MPFGQTCGQRIVSCLALCSALLSVGCGGSDDEPADASPSLDSGEPDSSQRDANTAIDAVIQDVLLRSFPDPRIDFFDATKVHPDARGFQVNYYEQRNERVLFLPWGSVAEPLGVLLAYRTRGDFASAASYDAVDLTVLVHPAAEGFGTGFIDNANRWLYLQPYRKKTGLRVTPNGLAVRFDLAKQLSDPSAYQTFDVATLSDPPPRLGWVTGAFASRHAYFAPTNEVGGPMHGILLRYDAARAFDDPSAWDWFDLEANVHAQAIGFQSAVAVGRWIYLIPYGVGYSALVRYDTTRSFKNPASYEVVDMETLHPEAVGYTGWLVLGERLLFTPWRDLSQPRGAAQSVSLAALYDTRGALSARASWSFIDLTAIHTEAKGYQGAWRDQDGFVHFVPTANYGTGDPPPFVVWDSTRRFDNAQSWRSYPSTGVPPSTVAAFDGTSAYLAPYGVDTKLSGLITRVRTQAP